MVAGRRRDRAVVADRAGVPARGRQQVARLLRPQEARRLQRRVHPQALARRVGRGLRPVAARAWDRERFRRDRPAHPGADGHARRRRDRWSTSCSPTIRRSTRRRGRRRPRPSSRRRSCAISSSAYETCDWDAATLEGGDGRARRALRGQAQCPGGGAGGGHRPVRRPAVVRSARGAGPRRVVAKAPSGPSPIVMTEETQIVTADEGVERSRAGGPGSLTRLDVEEMGVGRRAGVLAVSLLYYAVTLIRSVRAGRQTDPASGGSDRRARRGPVRRAAVAATRRSARSRARAVQRGRGAGRDGDRRQPARRPVHRGGGLGRLPRRPRRAGDGDHARGRGPHHVRIARRRCRPVARRPGSTTSCS